MKKITEIEKVLQKKPEEMARIFDCSLSAYYRYRNEKVQPNIGCIDNLLKEVPQLNPDWLFNGHDPVYRNTDNQKNSTWGVSLQFENGDSERFSSLPFLQISAPSYAEEGAISLQNWEEPGSHFILNDSFLKRHFGNSVERIVAVEVNCQVMVPLIPEHSICLVDTGIDRYTDEAIYLVQLHRSIKLKILQQLPSGTLLLSAASSAFPSMELDPHEEGFRILGRVLWMGRHM